MPRQPADFFGLALAWGGLAFLVYLVYLVVAPFFVPLGWASVFAILFYPWHEGSQPSGVRPRRRRRPRFSWPFCSLRRWSCS